MCAARARRPRTHASAAALCDAVSAVRSLRARRPKRGGMSVARLNVMVRDLQAMGDELIPDERKQKEEEELKDADAFTRAKHKLANVMSKLNKARPPAARAPPLQAARAPLEAPLIRSPASAPRSKWLSTRR
jgi:hypothetical protein